MIYNGRYQIRFGFRPILATEFPRHLSMIRHDVADTCRDSGRHVFMKALLPQFRHQALHGLMPDPDDRSHCDLAWLSVMAGVVETQPAKDVVRQDDCEYLASTFTKSRPF